jgi:hypothetical protein
VKRWEYLWIVEAVTVLMLLIVVVICGVELIRAALGG